ncbi:enoyl-CoA hydratase [Pseudoalteromonas shioyasakiensis]|uniref:enoyl-CoA hydratase n=1 Tax=Pseudoalteromonas shioyasakiensis TaxID=1190813 RepID=UPI0021180A75|nr:enoyl-CoA hydratase [Pseudoalteromonas shioyasakiensis]MCQ8881396.1 enoyl-CoA hydratase [Pseudoalteromonas shioyasakiensis]
MSNPSIDLNIDGNVAVLTMNNPPANTWTQDTLTALKETVTELNANKNVYALVITGQGEKFFSAGADLNVFASGDKGVAATMSKVFGDAFEALTNFRGVSIAAINGYAMGGGLEVALACDIRIAEDQAQMALPEAKVGLLPCAGGTQNLAWLVGEGWAKRMILCGERLKADKAREIGLVEEVVGAGESLAAAMKLANQVGEQSPVAVTACKELIQKGRTQPMAHALPLERELFVQLFDTQDQKEGVNAFLEKRKANWVNG